MPCAMRFTISKFILVVTAVTAILGAPAGAFSQVGDEEPVGEGLATLGERFVRGDANLDRQVDLTDAVKILEYLFRRALFLGCFDAADLNDDGVIDVSDPVYLLGYLFLGEPEPPAPFPDCEADPTEDSLHCRVIAACPLEERDVLVNSIGLEFVLIEPGTFLMGSPETEVGRRDDENLHRVTLTCGFYMSRTEVTQGQYRAVMGRNPSFDASPPEDTAGGTLPDTLPVNRVTWFNAVEFCRRLSQRENVTYRLPTEAEWEYACRAGTTTRWWFGDLPGCAPDSRGDCGRRLDLECRPLYTYEWFCARLTQRVATSRPNPWGLYDMHANMPEWVSDWYGRYPRIPVTDPAGPPGGAEKVIRGGGGGGYAGGRSAARGRATPDAFVFIGFRVLRELPDCSPRPSRR